MGSFEEQMNFCSKSIKKIKLASDVKKEDIQTTAISHRANIFRIKQWNC